MSAPAKVRTVTVLTHGRAGQTAEAVRALRLVAERMGASLRFDPEESGKHGLVNDDGCVMCNVPVSDDVDLCIVLGGDGTALSAARNLAADKIPILAVNVGGHLGFLTESSEEFSTETVWDRLSDDRFAVQRRMMLQASIFEGNRTNLEPVSDRYLALNEMCVKPASADRMVTSILEMEIDGEVVDQYQGDGLIVATPTGSTCYNLAANGPIIHPGMDAIAVTPICALSLSSRAIILPPGSVVSIWPLVDRDINTKLWMDGVLATSIWPGQRVIILRENYSYYQTLREKLQWAGARIHYSNNHRN
mgnify:CR=1 FL=1